ncbi:MAG: peptidyl arginine deiminase, type III [Parcubacteria group bacterium Gr01-1014_29]|nr:MAG: peptidyl arginine deiminase, type III [Parcubacteria group bacterium Gr01-1014_29]
MNFCSPSFFFWRSRQGIKTFCLLLVSVGWLLVFPVLPAKADSFTLTLTPDAPEYMEGEKANVTIAVAAPSGERLSPRRLELIVRFGLKDDPSPPLLAQFLPLPAPSVIVRTRALPVGAHYLRAELFRRGNQERIKRKTRQIQFLEADIARFEARLAQIKNPRQQEPFQKKIARVRRSIDQLQAEIKDLGIPLAFAKISVRVKPLLEITFPQEGETFENALKISLRGALGSLAFGKPAVLINGTALPEEEIRVDPETREFLASGIPVNNGANVIEAQVASVSKTITITNKDTLPPFFTLHVDPPASIQPGAFFISTNSGGLSLRLHIRSEEADEVGVIVNGIPVAVTKESGGFVGEIQNLVPYAVDVNNARIEVRDAAGNLAAGTVQIAALLPEEPKIEERKARFAKLIFEELDGTPILGDRGLVNEVQFGEDWVQGGAITTEPEIRIRGIFQSAIQEVGPGEFLRIYEGTGVGQVAEIDTLGNGSLTVKNVWQTPTEVALGPGGPGSAGGADCVWVCILGPSIPPQRQWFHPPDATSKYVLVANTRFWLDKDSRPVPAIISVREVKNDTALWNLNRSAQQRIEIVKNTLEAAAGRAINFISVPDIFMGELGASDIVDRTGIAFTPGIANFQSVGSNLYFAKSYGPTDALGRDVLEEKTRAQIPGNAEVFVEDWNLYHRLMGQVHCGTYVKRKIYDFDWWER